MSNKWAFELSSVIAITHTKVFVFTDF